MAAAALMLAGTVAAACAPRSEGTGAGGIGPGEARTGGIAAPARDGNVAIREEFDAALAASDRAAALGLFVRRHPGHPLADRARALLGGAGGNGLD